MKTRLVAGLCLLLAPLAGQRRTDRTAPKTMTKMVVRLIGPDIRAGSFAALPKTIYRAGEDYARIEDPPDAKQHIQKLTIIAGPDAYSVNLIDHRGTHATDKGHSSTPHLPVVLPFDAKHRLGDFDGIEFGAEYEFFESAGAAKKSGPIINAQPTVLYELATPLGPARLVMRSGSEVPVYLTWQTPDGTYKYEYISYDEVPFERKLFARPGGIQWKEIPPDPDAGT